MPPLNNIIVGTILTICLAVLALLWDMNNAEGAAPPESAHSRADIAAAQVCNGSAFEWHGKTLVCCKEQP